MKKILEKTKTEAKYLPRRFVTGGEDKSGKKTNAEQFNVYFINKEHNLAANIQSYEDISYEFFLKIEGPVLEIKEITEDKFQEALSSLNSNKSPGYHDISSNFVKAVSKEVFSTIKYLFNVSVQQGVFPDKLKIAGGTPSLENCGKSLLKNYRPISLMSPFSKFSGNSKYNRLF